MHTLALICRAAYYSVMELLQPRPPQHAIKQIVVRPARPEDERRILAINLTCFGDERTISSTIRHHWDVAETEMGVCGYALSLVKGQRVYIERIAVFADCRKLGIGTALIEGIATRAQQRRLKRVICLSSEFAPTSNHQFLAGQGFWSQVHPAPQRLRRPLDTPEGEERRGVYLFTRSLETDG